MTPSGSDPAEQADAAGSDDALAREAEAAQAEAEAAQARAEAARARAEELRQQLQTTPESTPSRRLPPRSAVLAGFASAVAAALLAATGLMLWQHQQASADRQRNAEFAAAARQGVVNLMAIDYNTADESVKRVLDGSTGTFKTNFAETAEDFAKALRDEKIITTATVNDVAVETMTADSAVVLVSATSRRQGPSAPQDQQQPRVWRVVVTLERDGGQIKMSNVEFV